MCTLAIYFQVSTAYPIVVVANRDEFLDRPTVPPHQLADSPWVFGGQDLRAAGTWLGINGNALVAGLLNRRTNQTPDPTRRSRGQLCLDGLRHSTPQGAAAAISREPGNTYNPFNLLLASPQQACVIGNFTGDMRRIDLSPGVHLLSNLELNDTQCPRIAKSFGLFAAAAPSLTPSGLPQFLATVKTVLSDHSTPLDPRSSGPPNNLCVHLPTYGTRSSSILVYDASLHAMRLWFADGPPCRTSYIEIFLPPLL